MLVIGDYLIKEELTNINENLITDLIDENLPKIKKKISDFFGSTSKRLRGLEKKLTDAGLDVEKIKKAAINAAKESTIKSGRISGFRTKVNKFTNDVSDNKYSLVKESGKIALSIILIAGGYFISTFFMHFLIECGLSTRIVLMLTDIICAPLLEETSKLISIKSDATGIYFILFNALEFSKHMVHDIGLGLNLPTAIMRSIPTVIMHLVTTLIQSESNKSGEAPVGWSLGVIIHALWNSLTFLGK